MAPPGRGLLAAGAGSVNARTLVRKMPRFRS